MLATLSAAALAHVSAAATTSTPILWYVTRAAAVSAYVTITVGVLLGLSRSLAGIARLRIPWTLDEAHQFLAVLTAGFVLLHLGALVLDQYHGIRFSILNLLIPLNEPYAPLAVDLGVVALYALVVVLASSWLRQRLRHVTWRTLHYLSFAVFVLVTLHGLLGGTDASTAWMRLLYIAGAGAVGLLTFIRFFAPPEPARVPMRSTARR